MATTPRKYLWQSLQLRADEADGVGGIAHYFDEEAQSLYLHTGIAGKELYVEEGHWQDLTAGDELNLETPEYSQLSWTHPATGSLYGTAIMDGSPDTVYLLRYTYARDIGKMLANGKWSQQVDNPVNQFNATIKSWDSDAFTKSATLFTPGARAAVGLMMGDSDIYYIGTIHLDEIQFAYNSDNVSFSGRNRTGYILNDSTFNEKGTKNDTVLNLCKWVLDFFGLGNYEIETNLETLQIEYDASDTGLKVLQTICDKASGILEGTDWDIEERYDGKIIIGFNAFRASYLPKSVFKFANSDLFKRSSSKIIDGAYSKVYCTGRDNNNNELTPVIEDVTTWRHWDVIPNKTYFAPTLEKTTQAGLAQYAKVLARQLKKTGLKESYTTNIKPQLLVGDYATSLKGEDETDIGVITQVTHQMGEDGYRTDFTADSGGDKQSILTRDANSTARVYTSSRRNSGDNRNKRLLDYIKNTATQIVRTTTPGGGGTVTAGVQDVTVDGVTVVVDNVAKFTHGDRITIANGQISASIEPFVIVDGKMCITYKGEVD